MSTKCIDLHGVAFFLRRFCNIFEQRLHDGSACTPSFSIRQICSYTFNLSCDALLDPLYHSGMKNGDSLQAGLLSDVFSADSPIGVCGALFVRILVVGAGN